MSNNDLIITSVTVAPTKSAGNIEVNGIWRGIGNPPNRLKNFYYNNDGLFRDLFELSEVSYDRNIEPYYTIGKSQPSGFISSSTEITVSYKLVNSAQSGTSEAVLDYFLGEDPDEYVSWDLIDKLK